MYNILKYFSTLERDFQPQMPHILGVASLALGVGSSILGGVSSANAARRAERLRQEQDAKNAAWFNRKYNESYIDTAAGRNAIRQAQDFAKRQTQRAEGAAAVAGGTDAAVAQAKESANKMIGDTIGNLAAQDTARKEQAVETYLGQQERSTAQQMANEKAKAAGIAQAAQGASNAMMVGATLLNNTSNTNNTSSRLTAATGGQSAGAYAGKNAAGIPSSSPSSPQLSSGVPTLSQYTQKHGAPIGRHGLTQ